MAKLGQVFGFSGNGPETHPFFNQRLIRTNFDAERNMCLALTSRMIKTRSHNPCDQDDHPAVCAPIPVIVSTANTSATAHVRAPLVATKTTTTVARPSIWACVFANARALLLSIWLFRVSFTVDPQLGRLNLLIVFTPYMRVIASRYSGKFTSNKWNEKSFLAWRVTVY